MTIKNMFRCFHGHDDPYALEIYRYLYILEEISIIFKIIQVSIIFLIVS